MMMLHGYPVLHALEARLPLVPRLLLALALTMSSGACDIDRSSTSTDASTVDAFSPDAAAPAATMVETVSSATLPASGTGADVARIDEPQSGAAVGRDVATALQDDVVSASTDGFTGRVLGDGTVRLSWQRDPGAEGYNVYRQGEYHTTVRGESFVDTTVSEGQWRYEIHSFTPGTPKRFRKIAGGLTLSVDRAGTAAGATDDAQQRTFTSATTVGFTGNVLGDGTVQLDWRRDPRAEGYNVYRQGRYLTTVLGEGFSDAKMPVGNYRYEIHSFTPGTSKTYSKIAKDLTVKVRRTADTSSTSRTVVEASAAGGAATDGFTGSVLGDGTVRLSWQRDPGAEGYNVYRQGEYYTTVRGESFVDTKVSEGEWRYEIHSFTPGTSKTYSKIAKDLTVAVGRPEGASSASRAVAETSIASADASTGGFTGKVLGDGTVRLDWQRDPNAEGYNVYRQGKYHTTVSGESFVDTTVSEGQWRYEIHSFTPGASKTYRKIAGGLTVEVREPDRIASKVLTPNAGTLDGYELVFADEFDTGTLDSSKWNTSFLWGADLTINAEQQYYVDINRNPSFGFDPFTFESDTLIINTIRTPAALRAKANGKPYLSGIITSYDAFKFTYGYAEIRARMPRGKGYWTAFWLLNAYYGDEDPEIDIVEFLGHERDVAYHTYHYYDRNGMLRSTESEPTTGIDFTADFHTFGVDWRPGSLIYYVDGIEVHRISDPEISDQDMYLIANTALGGTWPGSPDATTPIPGRYQIDYIRVYRQTSPYAMPPLSDQPEYAELADEATKRSPGHRPPFELWPEGYPGQR